mgnify:FL=1
MIGVIALAFLLIGYQTALFIHRATVLKIAQVRDEPDTVYVYRGGEDEISVQKKNGYHAPRAEAVRQNLPRRRVESFRFDPNTVSVEDLCRLGFTMKQAQSIDNYT